VVFFVVVLVVLETVRSTHATSPAKTFAVVFGIDMMFIA
jgi:hypothetical protein